jgi:hypothetical protein
MLRTAEADPVNAPTRTMLREQIIQLRARLLEIDGENAVAVFAADVWDELGNSRSVVEQEDEEAELSDEQEQDE